MLKLSYNRLGSVGNRKATTTKKTKKLQLRRLTEILRNGSCLDAIP